MAKEKTSIEVITPEKAKEYLANNLSDPQKRNRKINEGRVEFYAEMLAKGKWMLNGETIIFDNKGNLIDGQHRLRAVVASNTPMTTAVVRNVDNRSFLTIDTGASRSASDSFSIERIPNSVRIAAAIKKYIVMTRLAKMTSLRSTDTCSAKGHSKTKVSTQDQLEEYLKHSDFWQEECSFGTTCFTRCRIISISEIMSISAYLQLNKGYNPEVVHDFFNQVFFEEKCKNNTLAVFRRMVVNDAMSASGVRMTAKHKTQLLIKCWEAFKNNKEYKILKWSKDQEGEYTFK